MISSSQQGRIRDVQISGKAGLDANESRFGDLEVELRERKSLFVPCLDDGMLRIDQGWTPSARHHDYLRITAEANGKTLELFLKREELEQALFFFAQGDEMIKYSPPKIIKNYAALKRKQREQSGDFGRVSVTD